MRLIFMGTPEAAVSTLRRCIEDGHEIAAVWTQPDKASGRGNKLTAPPVKEFALAHNLTVYQFAKIKTDEARELFASHYADACIVVAYGRILPSEFLSAPRQGCINVHFSLLPKLRGAAPVNWAIVQGETITGVTTMQMDEGLDTGAILLQRSIEIRERETASALMTRLAEMGAELLSETLARLDEITPRPQDKEEATFAPVLRREDGLIDWSHEARAIDRRVRGFDPWPGAFTFYNSRRLIIRETEPLAEAINLQKEHGEVVAIGRDEIIIACGDQSQLRLLAVQPEGKPTMRARDFINGARIKAGEKLGR
jgi:methionyl-tRNA formyltransferase